MRCLDYFLVIILIKTATMDVNHPIFVQNIRRRSFSSSRSFFIEVAWSMTGNATYNVRSTLPELSRGY